MTEDERRASRRDQRACIRAGLYLQRPRTLADCEEDNRPCPFVSCRHHLYLETDEETGAIKLLFPDKEVHQMPATCSLKVAARGRHTYAALGRFLNLTDEGAHWVVAKALVSYRRNLGWLKSRGLL